MGKIRNNSGLLINAFSYILPIQIFSGVVLFLHSLVDSILVGRFLGENNLAIIGLTAPIGLTITFIGCVISNGFQILCGNAIGRGKKNNINATFSNAIVLSFIFGIIAALFCAAFSGNISSWVGINNIQMEESMVLINKQGYFKKMLNVEFVHPATQKTFEELKNIALSTLG